MTLMLLLCTVIQYSSKGNFILHYSSSMVQWINLHWYNRSVVASIFIMINIGPILLEQTNRQSRETWIDFKILKFSMGISWIFALSLSTSTLNGGD